VEWLDQLVGGDEVEDRAGGGLDLAAVAVEHDALAGDPEPLAEEARVGERRRDAGGDPLDRAGVVDRAFAGHRALVEDEDRRAVDRQDQCREALVAEGRRGPLLLEARLVIGEPAHRPGPIAAAEGEQAVEFGVGERGAGAVLALQVLGPGGQRRGGGKLRREGGIGLGHRRRAFQLWIPYLLHWILYSFA
jgi:hypothetical protein